MKKKIGNMDAQIGRRWGLISVWKGNLGIIGLLIAIVLGYFYWQVRQVHQTFLTYAQEHSGLLAEVIELNARNAVLSQKVVEEIVQGFMASTARFVDYLEAVEPFSSEELTEFSLEAGLAGIRIKNIGKAIEGPAGWLGSQAIACTSSPRSLYHLPQNHLYLLNWPQAEGPGCVIVGINAARIESLQKQVSLPHLLQILSGLSSIRHIRIEKETAHTHASSPKPDFMLLDGADGKTAEARLTLGEDVLIVGLATDRLSSRIRQLWNEFFVFSGVLIFLGLFFSWLLHRFQSDYMNRIRLFERELALQREDAALGRATATITHEIRNPLNAISMGLQRLSIEATGLTDEYQDLVTTLLKAVQRTNNIITGLKRYAGPIEPRTQKVRLDQIIHTILTLYQSKCDASGIEIQCELNDNGWIIGDADMLEQVTENLVKNGIEAQPEGGYLHLTLNRKGSTLTFAVENMGFTLTKEEAHAIFEPYYTTKTKGTGLGVTVASRIIRSHKGRLDIDVPKPGVIRMVVYLPTGETG